MSATKRILTIDDDCCSTMMMHFVLEGHGYALEVAQNGLEAWKVLDSKQIDLVITDNEMPLLRGEDLCAEWRRRPQFAALPIVMITGGYDKLDIDEFKRRFSPIEILPKPIEPERLLQVIDGLLALSV